VAIRSLGARIPDRFGAAATTRVSLGVTSAGLALIGMWRTPVGLVTGTVLLGVGVALFTPALFALAIEGVPPKEGRLGDDECLLDLAFGIGPATLGFVAAAVGRGSTFLVGAAVAAAGLAVVIVTRLGRGSERTPPGARAR
jgi:predicted MFS family arabinose efflux permease